MADAIYRESITIWYAIGKIYIYTTEILKWEGWHFMTQNQIKRAYLLMFNMFITMGGIGIIVPVMPAYLYVFGVGGQVLGFLTAIFALAQFLLSPIAGDLSDRHGRKIYHLWLNCLRLCSNFIRACTEVWVLFLARFLVVRVRHLLWHRLWRCWTLQHMKSAEKEWV